jgi:hypothetical protein
MYKLLLINYKIKIINYFNINYFRNFKKKFIAVVLIYVPIILLNL